MSKTRKFAIYDSIVVRSDPSGFFVRYFVGTNAQLENGVGAIVPVDIWNDYIVPCLKIQGVQLHCTEDDPEGFVDRFQRYEDGWNKLEQIHKVYDDLEVMTVV